jgi:hypothetical protein
MDVIQMTRWEFGQLLDADRRETVKAVLQELGYMKKTITRARVIELYGNAIFEKSKAYVAWQKKGDGRTSSVICMLEEFENYLRKFDLEQKPITTRKNGKTKKLS